MAVDPQTSAVQPESELKAPRHGFRSPFVYRHALSPLRNPTICLPRKDCVASIEQEFALRRWVAVRGAEGSGRTTILKLVAHELAAQQARRGGIVPLLMNMQAVANADTPDVFRAFLNEAVVGFVRMPHSVGSQNEPLLKYLRMHEQRADATTFGEILMGAARQCHNRSLLLMLDNADRVSNSIRGPVFRVLVAIFNQQNANREKPLADVGYHIHVVVTGDEGDWLGGLYTSLTSPLKSCVEELHLSDFAFREEDIFALAHIGQRESQIPIHESALKEIAVRSRGLPTRVQRFLSEALRLAHSHLLPQVTDREVRSAAKFIEGDVIRKRLRHFKRPLKALVTTDCCHALEGLRAIAGDLRDLWLDAEGLSPAQQELLALVDLIVMRGIDERGLTANGVDLLGELADALGSPADELGQDTVDRLRNRAIEVGIDMVATFGSETHRVIRADHVLRRTLVQRPEARLCMHEKNEGRVVHVGDDGVEVEYETPGGPLTQVYHREQFLGGKLPEEGHHFEAQVFAWSWPHVPQGIEHLLTPEQIDAISKASEKGTGGARDI